MKKGQTPPEPSGTPEAGKWTYTVHVKPDQVEAPSKVQQINFQKTGWLEDLQKALDLEPVTIEHQTSNWKIFKAWIIGKFSKQ